MNKPREIRLHLESYPHVVLIQTRFADIDLQMHINSIRIGEIFEEARFRFVGSIGFDVPLGVERRLVAALNHTYINEAIYPGDLHVANGIIKIGRTSWTIGQAAFQGGRCVALCDITIVRANATGPVALADAHRELLQKHAVKEP
jgi:acyl-CoA thioester hydrolase